MKGRPQAPSLIRAAHTQVCCAYACAAGSGATRRRRVVHSDEDDADDGDDGDWNEDDDDYDYRVRKVSARGRGRPPASSGRSAGRGRKRAASSESDEYNSGDDYGAPARPRAAAARRAKARTSRPTDDGRRNRGMRWPRDPGGGLADAVVRANPARHCLCSDDWFERPTRARAVKSYREVDVEDDEDDADEEAEEDEEDDMDIEDDDDEEGYVRPHGVHQGIPAGAYANKCGRLRRLGCGTSATAVGSTSRRPRRMRAMRSTRSKISATRCLTGASVRCASRATATPHVAGGSDHQRCGALRRSRRGRPEQSTLSSPAPRSSYGSSGWAAPTCTRRGPRRRSCARSKARHRMRAGWGNDAPGTHRQAPALLPARCVCSRVQEGGELPAQARRVRRPAPARVGVRGAAR